MNWKIYYNPKCGTCRKVFELMEAKGVHPEVVEVLKTPPDARELDGLLKALDMDPEAIVRKKEALYSELGLANKKLGREEWLRLLAENPILIERPIVVKGSRALLARPPEKVEALLE